MVNWIRNQLTVYRFYLDDNEPSSVIEWSMPLEGESDREYLKRLIVQEHPKE